jgi:hypothetical protein
VNAFGINFPYGAKSNEFPASGHGPIEQPRTSEPANRESGAGNAPQGEFIGLAS